jgi:hypothetical protein
MMKKQLPKEKHSLKDDLEEDLKRRRPATFTVLKSQRKDFPYERRVPV